MVEAPVPRYVFARGERSILAEVYFPKKIVYQGTIFTALENGLDQRFVRNYLSGNIDALLDELRGYPELFDPRQYSRQRPPSVPVEISRDDAVRRVNRYRSHFTGWSMYEVDGYFRGRRGRDYEERTQVVRLIFRLESRYTNAAVAAGCYDVYEQWSFGL